MSNSRDSTRVLLLGGTGLIGHKLWQELPKTFENVWTTVRKPKDQYSSYGALFGNDRVIDRLDVLDFDRLVDVLETLKPNVVINAVGVTKRHIDRVGVDRAIETNSIHPVRVADWCSNKGSRFIQISTDCVFSGSRGNYSDQDKPDASDVYGISKMKGEVLPEDALVLRGSFIGRELNHSTELLEWMISNRGKKVFGFTKALYTGVSSITFSKIISQIIRQHTNLTGIYNIASDVISKYDLLSLMNSKFQLGSQIEPNNEVILKRNLNGTKLLEATGIKIPSWDEMMTEIANDETPYESWRMKRSIQ